MSVAARVSPNQRANRKASWLSMCLAGGSECANCLAASFIVVVSLATVFDLMDTSKAVSNAGPSKPPIQSAHAIGLRLKRSRNRPDPDRREHRQAADVPRFARGVRGGIQPRVGL